MNMTQSFALQDGTVRIPAIMDVTRPIKMDAATCARIQDVLSRVGDKWSMLILMSMTGGSLRFSELHRSIDGISQRMLTRTLRNLERDGYVKRTVIPTVPIRVDYELTEMGRSAAVPVLALGKWAMGHLDHIDVARRKFDKKNGGDTIQS
jgi:DNA-binding HxlR family transcriptional regulator